MDLKVPLVGRCPGCALSGTEVEITAHRTEIATDQMVTSADFQLTEGELSAPALPRLRPLWAAPESNADPIYLVLELVQTFPMQYLIKGRQRNKR
jgi:hypothetical protein